MFTHPRTSTALIVISGLLLSILALVASDPVCDAIQKRRLNRAAHQHVALITKGFKETLASVESTVSCVERADEMTQEEMEQATTSLHDITGFHSVEIARRVTPEQRMEFQNELRRRGYGEVRTLRRGGAMVIPNSEVTYPIVYLQEEGKSSIERIGVQRPRWTATRMAEKYGGAFLTSNNRFFDDDVQRIGIIATPRDRDQRDPKVILMVTVDRLVDDSLLVGAETTVAMKDISGASRFITQEDVNDTELSVLLSDERRFAAQQRIGGRLFSFDVTEKYGSGYRPKWIPWTGFFLGNAMTCVLGLTWLQRGQSELLEKNKQLRAEVEQRIVAQRNLQSMLDFREHERELIAHEIHDGIVQDVIGVQMLSQSTLAMVRDDQPELRERTELMASVLINAIREARLTINYLKPRVVDEVGLIAALEASTAEDFEKHEFETNLSYAVDFPRLPLLAERIIYRIIREGVRNARQHSGGATALVSLAVAPNKIIVEMSDEGMGFEPTEVENDRFGLSGMRCRAEMLKGHLSIHTSNTGTQLVLEFPLNIDVPELPVSPSFLVED